MQNSTPYSYTAQWPNTAGPLPATIVLIGWWLSFMANFKLQTSRERFCLLTWNCLEMSWSNWKCEPNYCVFIFLEYFPNICWSVFVDVCRVLIIHIYIQPQRMSMSRLQTCRLMRIRLRRTKHVRNIWQNKALSSLALLSFQLPFPVLFPYCWSSYHSCPG